MTSNSKPSLRQQKKQQARSSILQAAEALIGEKGYQQTRTRDIAARAELSYQTLYNYFPSKGRILQALLTDRVQDASRPIQEILQAHDGPLLDALDAMNAAGFQAIASQDKTLWRIVVIDRISQQGTASYVYQLIDGFAREALGQRLLEAKNAGELNSGVHLGRLTDVLFDLSDYSLTRFLLDPHATPSASVARLGGQIRLVASPYLAGA